MKKLLFLLLAVCLIGFLAGCDGGGGGGGSDDDDDDDNSRTYTVTGLVDMTGVTNLIEIDDGIQFDQGGHTYQNFVTLTGNKETKEFTLHERELEDGVVLADCTFHGTFEVSGAAINVHCTLTTYANGDPDNTVPWDDTFTVIDDDTIHVWGWVMED